MKTKNIISKPVESISYKSNDTGGEVEVVGANLTTYKTGIFTGLPDEARILKTEDPIDLSDFKFSNQSVVGSLPQLGAKTAFSLTGKDSRYPESANYIFDFGSGGKIIQEFQIGNRYTTYLWSYNGQYPVARIENASFSEVQNAVSNISTSFIDELRNSLTQSYIDTKLSQLRNEIASDLPNAMVTTFTYKPLEGISTQIDPANIITSYEYDGLGRLKNVKDSDGKILNHTEYHYAE
jgi:YD repeat-containing protein